MLELLKKLTQTNAPSGSEELIHSIITDEILLKLDNLTTNKSIKYITADIDTETDNDNKTLTSKGYVDDKIKKSSFNPTQLLTLSGEPDSLQVNNNASFNGKLNCNSIIANT